jgi:hypothetical protein
VKQYTDFNDLATKSVLGSAAVEHQVRPVIESMIERREALGRQARLRQRVQQQENKLRNIAKITGIQFSTTCAKSSKTTAIDHTYIANARLRLDCRTRTEIHRQGYNLG